jgi:hypothetical protein
MRKQSSADGSHRSSMQITWMAALATANFLVLLACATSSSLHSTATPTPTAQVFGATAIGTAPSSPTVTMPVLHATATPTILVFHATATPTTPVFQATATPTTPVFQVIATATPTPTPPSCVGLQANSVILTYGQPVTLTSPACSTVTNTGYMIDMWDVFDNVSVAGGQCSTGITCQITIPGPSFTVCIKYQAFIDRVGNPSTAVASSQVVTVCWQP